MNEDGRVERAPDMLVGKIDRAIKVFGCIGRFDGRLGKEAAEGFGGEADIILVVWINAGDQRPGKLIGGRAAELLGVWMFRDKAAVTLFRTRIIGVARRDLREDRTHLLQKLLALLPASVLENDAGGIAV